MSIYHDLCNEWDEESADVETVMSDEEYVGVLVKYEVDNVLDNLLLFNILVLIKNVITNVSNLEPRNFHISSIRFFITWIHQKVIHFTLEDERAKINVGVLYFDVTNVDAHCKV